MKLVKLKNGQEEAEPLVAVAMQTLREIFTTKPIHFYELVTLCRNSSHKPFGKTGEDLYEMSLLQKDNSGYIVHDSVRNVVLSAVTGNDLEMQLTSPLA